MDIKLLFGIGSVIPAAIGYFPYVIDVVRGRTKPHAYSWLVWSAIAGVGFVIQVQGQGGAGSWLLGAATGTTFSIFVLSLFYGHKDIHTADKMSLLTALIALALLVITREPLLSAVLITATEAIGAFFPTFRKSYANPYEETLLTYAAYAVSIVLSLLALERYTLANMLYPVVDCALYVALVTFLVVRRRKVKPPAKRGR